MFESPARPVPPRRDGRGAREPIRHSAAPPDRHLLALGGQAARRVRRRPLEILRRQAAIPRSCARSASPRPSRATRTIRTSRRLVGKVDIRKLEHFSQHDPDAYSYSGGLNRTTQGLLEFVEMFKAPIKVLHPLLTATQEGNYAGTENIGALPFQGIVLAHSNESEWEQFKNNKNNEAFLDRICVVKVPYCLRVTEEAMIYAKLLESSELAEAPCAPEVLEILARFCILSRLKEHQNSPLYSKMRVYNGESLKDTDPKAKSIQEYREAAGVSEGMSGRLDPLRLQGAVRDLQLRQRGDRRRPRASDVRARAGDQARAIPQGGRGALSRLHQVDAGAALRRVHRPRDPEGLYRVLQRIRPEPVRPLHRLRRRLDRGAGLQGPRHRPGVRPAGARRRTVEDREAGRHRQSEGLPQRDRQVRVALARRQRRARTRPGRPTRRSAR